MRKIIFVFMLIFALVACSAIKPVIRTIIDIATLLCMNAASEQPIDVLQGKTPQQFCKAQRNLQPFIDQLLKAKATASQKAGLSKPQ